MPGDLKIINNKGVSPRSFRMRWWEETTGKTFEEISFESKFTLPQYEIPKQIVIQNNPYPEDAPIVFFGHYCRHNGPHIVKPVSYTHLRAHETVLDLVCRLLLENKK